VIVRLLPWLVVASVQLAAEAADASRAYERWVRPPSLDRSERRLLHTVRSWGQQRNMRIRHDARLARTAQSLVSRVPRDQGARFDLERARIVAQRFGWTDGQLATVALRTDQGRRAALLRQLDLELGNLEVNRVGLARENDAVLVLFSRRLVNLAPVSARVARGETLPLTGRVHHGCTTVRLAVQQPNGSIRRATVPCRGPLFSTRVLAGDQAGVLRVELLLDRGRGPEVAANFPVGVGTDAHPESGATLPEVETREGAEATLMALVLGSRQAHGFSLPAQSAHLADAARAHAREMKARDFFAHVSPTSGDLTDRLRAREVAFVRAVENIAVADTVEAAFQQWLESPAHHANLIDKDVAAMGVGVANGAGRVYAVVVLARLADDGGIETLRHRAMRELNQARRRLGLRPLARDRVLERLAHQHAREIAHLGEVSDTSPVRGYLVDTVFDEAGVEEAAADVYLANTVDVVAGSRHLRESFHRVGVGVHRTAGRDGAQLWIAVIYAD
jgi:uncharacterized protein YkwD